SSLLFTTLFLSTQRLSKRPHSLSSYLLNELAPKAVLRILLISHIMSNTFLKIIANNALALSLRTFIEQIAQVFDIKPL
ncbi:MAG: hypothetical protein ACRC0M_00630, partial [Legionella sp.]